MRNDLNLGWIGRERIYLIRIYEYKHIHVNMLSGLLINSILLPESFFGIRSIILI